MVSKLSIEKSQQNELSKKKKKSDFYARFIFLIMVAHIFFGLTIVELIGYFLCMRLLHLKDNGKHSPIFHTIAKYAKWAHKRYFQRSQWLSILKSLCMAFWFWFWDYKFPFKEWGVILLLMSIVWYVGLYFFSPHNNKSLLRLKNSLHTFLPILQFALLSFFMANFVALFGQTKSPLVEVLPLVDWISRIGILGVVIGMVVPFFGRYVGLFERMYLYMTNVYFLIVCIVCFIIG